VERPVIVTGAAGFAGRHLLDHLVQVLPAAQQLIAWRRPGGTAAPTVNSRISWNVVDLLDEPAVDLALAAAQPATVFHCAGSPHVASSWLDTLVPLQANVLGTHYLLRSIEQHAPDARVLVPSSALVYEPEGVPLGEEHPLVPRTPYGVSKLAQEMLAGRAQLDQGLLTLIARPFNHIGPGQDPSFVASALARQIAEAESGLSAPVIHVGNLDARRDLTDVRDTVRAYETIASRGVPGRVYNVCSGRARRMRDLLDGLLDLSTVRVEIRLDADRLRPSDIPLLVGDPSRISSELGWRAEIPIEQTLADLLAHWRGRVAARRSQA
jgi:GDP-4-dehydro-6-deoxy-D-mannose reductase